MQTLSLVLFLTLLLPLRLFSQELSAKMVLQYAEHSIKDLKEFSCDFSYHFESPQIVDTSFSTSGKLSFLRVKSDKVLAGKLRIETESYSILYDLKKFYYSDHKDKTIQILNVAGTKLNKWSYPLPIQAQSPKEVMNEDFKFYEDEEKVTFDIIEESDSSWVIRISRNLSHLGIKLWNKDYKVDKKTFLLKETKLVINNFEGRQVQRFRFENFEPYILAREKTFSHFDLPTEYHFFYH